jgi:hypothetical protein
MLATEVLVAHHNELRALMARLAALLTEAPDRLGERRSLVDVLMAELSMHEMIEDSIFYPAMSDVSALVPLAHAEHRQLSDQLATVLRTPPGSERFAEEFMALRTAVEHHAGEEEHEMFPEVERKVSPADLEQIGAALAARLKGLRASRLTQLRLRLKRHLVRHTHVRAAGPCR